MKKLLSLLIAVIFLGSMTDSKAGVSHPPKELTVKTVYQGVQIGWEYELPDTLISYNDGTPSGIWAPGAKHGLGVIFDLSGIDGATLELLDFVHFGRNLMSGPYDYKLHIFNMDSLKTIKIIDSLVAGNADTLPRFEAAVELGSLPAGGSVGIFVEGLSTPNGKDYFPAVMTDTTALVANTSFYCVNVDDPFLESDPDYTNIYELNLVSPTATNLVMDLWVNVNGETKSLLELTKNSQNSSFSQGRPADMPQEVYQNRLSGVSNSVLQKPAGSESGFIVFRGNNYDNLEILETVGADQRSFSDLNITEKSTFYYGISRYDGENVSTRVVTEYIHPELLSVAETRKDSDGDFVPDRLDENVYLKGVVSTPNFSSGTSYFIQDGTAGINIYSGDFNKILNVGDSVFVGGRLAQYKGLAEIIPENETDIEVINFGNTVDTLEISIADAGEEFEGMLVAISDVSIDNPGDWPSEGNNGTNLQLTDGTNYLKLYIDKDTELDGWTPLDGNLRIVGIIDQYTSNDPANDGYELRPRYISDFTSLVSIEKVDDFIPAKYALQQNYPNPFNPQTTILYELPASSDVQLTVYNALGQQISNISQTGQAAGKYKVIFDGTQMAGGVYFYRVKAAGFEQVRKMILVK